MTTIEADIDRYGSLVRASCLADFLEVSALHGLSCTFAQLEDMVSDSWPRLRQIYAMPDDDPESEDDSYATEAVHCISERLDILGDRYPFEIGKFRITLRKDFSPYESPYVALLCITVVHAYALEPSLRVDHLFESMVANALTDFGLIVGNVGQLSRDNNLNFVRTIDALSSTVRIAMDPNAAVRHRAANDEGIDVFAHLDWRDDRSGRWTLIGQATVGSSDSWQKKMGEPKPVTWQKFMAETSPPLVFLAVPHHVERNAFRAISEGTAHTILDRTRLTSFLSSLPSELHDVIDRVMNASVQNVKV